MDSHQASALLELARRDLPTYFALATSAEVQCIDSLVIARAEYAIALARPRAELTSIERTRLEQVTNAREREFTMMRELVAKSAAFGKLPPVEGVRLKSVLFDPPRPLA